MDDLMNKRPDYLRTVLADVARDFATWPVPGPRFVDEFECLAAVLMAIALSHLFNIRNVGWAAFSAYIVIRGSFSESLQRGSLRVLGTTVGASIAWVLAPQIIHSTPLLSLTMAVFGAVALYLALIGQCGYGWLLAGLTFAMVLTDGIEHSNVALADFARSRILEVSVGSFAAILVSAISALSVRKWHPHLADNAKGKVPIAGPRFWHKDAAKHALQAAVALALIPWIWMAFHLKALSQASITIMAVMMVPLADIAKSRQPASVRLRHRFIGCGIGGLLATGILILSHDSPIIMTTAVALGVIAGRHIENGKLGICYIGTQFALAFLVVLVPDCYNGLAIAPGFDRLIGILTGMALLEPTRVLMQLRLARILDKA